jgi:anti-sigma regulatory factor (Ser/Thr protein kinase)
LPFLRWHRTGGVKNAEAATVPQTRAFGGSPDQVRSVRAFVSDLVDGFPRADDVVLLVSELATNAVLHTASGAGGTFSVVVRVDGGLVRVEVHDLGSDEEPSFTGSSSPRESGAGLFLVESMADMWGFYGDHDGRVVWFEVHSK